ncbi:MAG: TonB-dependent receptor [Bacteroidales bacterium]
MKKIRLFLTGLFLVMTCSVFAQNITITGTVTDEVTGESIPFADVMVKGTQTGTSTDSFGAYSISAPADGTLVFNFLGYKNQEIAINGRAVINVTLASSAESLDDVIVVAYGTANKKSFTGSASVVKGNTISKRPVSNVTQALAGAAAGVQITSSTGQPGSSASIRIRGIGSISSSAEPLIILDGVPYSGALNSISAQDIESFTVLKDAAANSMYGSRGSNGVIMITTKKGKKGTTVNIEIREGINQRGVPAYDVVKDPQQYLSAVWTSLKNYATNDPTNSAVTSPGYTTPGQWASDNLTSQSYGTGGYNPYNVADNEIINAQGVFNPNASLLYKDDWLNEPLRNGLRQEYLASMQGGDDKTAFFFSASYLNEESYLVNSDFGRFSTRLKVDHQATDWFKIGSNLSYSRTNSNALGNDNTSAYANIFMFAQNIAPIYPVYAYDKQGNVLINSATGDKIYDYGNDDYGMGHRLYGANTNPLAQLLYDNHESSRDMFSAIGYAEIKFLKDFKFTANVSAQGYSYDENSYQTPIGGDALNVGGRNYRTFDKMFEVNMQQLLTYNHSFGKHSLDVLVGHETNSHNFRYIQGVKENFLIPDNPELDNAARILGVSSYSSNTALQSIISRVQYNYDYKYFLTGSYRRDASSKFAKDVRWGDFWSVGASWRLEQEEFMKGISWINNLKLKASYGTQGNDGIDTNLAYMDHIVVVPNNGEIGLSTTFRGNPDLTWEKSNNFNVGVDFEMFNRLSGTVEYFNKKTTDMLYAKPLPPSGGDPTWIYENAIDMRNYGVEVQLSFDIIATKDLLWNVSANATWQANEVLKLPADLLAGQDGYQTGSYWRSEGGRLYDYYMYEWAGVNPDNGHAQWYKNEYEIDGNGAYVLDDNGEKIITDKVKTENYSEAEYYNLGKHGLVDVYGGFSTSVSYKGVDFSANFAYQIGGYGTDYQYSSLSGNMESCGDNLHMDVIDNQWTTPRQETDFPILQWGLKDQNNKADYNLTSKSCLSLQNVTLGYTLPQSINDYLHIKTLRVYLTGDNLWLWSARKGFDPRTSFSGGTGYNYSAYRTISVGLNLTF